MAPDFSLHYTGAMNLVDQLAGIVGKRHILTGSAQTRRYRKGYRSGDGDVLCVARPGSLLELWRVTKACIEANVIIIMQAANTGLTGGSTPDGHDYDRDIVIVSTLRIDKVQLLDGGRQVLCQPGATLYQLEELLKPLGREPHSVIGSSCIGASVMGGVCNNSGGALIHRGPAYTELSLFARLNHDGTLELINHLGIDLGDDPEDILERLDRGDTLYASSTSGAASDPDYLNHIRDTQAATPARYNADPRRLYEASGCAGKLVVFAVRLDTFPARGASTMFYIGTNDTNDLADLRRDMLDSFKTLPVSAEYIHKEAYDIAEVYGKDTFLAVYHLGTIFLPHLFNAKSRFDALFEIFRLKHVSDHILQILSRLFPSHLPPRMQTFRARYNHHLMLVMNGESIDEVRGFLTSFFAKRPEAGYFECTAMEARKAHLHRFAAAGAGIRYQAVHSGAISDMVALDIALRRNDRDWFETLPPEIENAVAAKLYYGHFFCHVFHQDYLIRKGFDANRVKDQMLTLLDARGAEYPAEHNVGHVYDAKPTLKEFYKSLDPRNVFNPGIGKTSKKSGWA